ncbi:hypothetical protein BCR34DRAFT_593301 [Clohesyomyces aquaticus]|uniref:Uncharacterized protein n=1 Tax=Clohesyomyces aquaticus TaxID=1231657 RepID=A0A1Y1YJB8_9PLEO|nr:hypothetical protein BCR34DRAFT_593301 [Clohesyomyces aquaticus]
MSGVRGREGVGYHDFEHHVRRYLERQFENLDSDPALKPPQKQFLLAREKVATPPRMENDVFAPLFLEENQPTPRRTTVPQTTLPVDPALLFQVSDEILVQILPHVVAIDYPLVVDQEDTQPQSWRFLVYVPHMVPSRFGFKLISNWRSSSLHHLAGWHFPELHHYPNLQRILQEAFFQDTRKWRRQLIAGTANASSGPQPPAHPQTQDQQVPTRANNSGIVTESFKSGENTAEDEMKREQRNRLKTPSFRVKRSLGVFLAVPA